MSTAQDAPASESPDSESPDSETEPTATDAGDPEPYPQEVRILDIDDTTYILVGTAHVSQASVDLVHRVIETEEPDCVCVELDERRFQALSTETKWEELDLKEIIRQKQLTTLIVNLLLSSYQKKLGQELGVQPGKELLEATQVAEKLGAPVELCDRDVRITLRRATHATPFLSRLVLLSEIFLTMFDGPEVTEEQLEELREQDVLNELMTELGERHPSLKRVLIDERDAYLAQKIHDSPGQKKVAVVGAGHLAGIEKALKEHQEIDLEPLEVIPPVRPIWKVLGWAVPVVILGLIAWIGWSDGASQAADNVQYWILANGIPASIGALIALAHPLVIVTAFVAAPLTSLSPVIGTAYVTAFLQAWLVPPKVKEFQSVADDIGRPIMWWKNRLLRIFLAYILPGMGSVLGSILGLAHIVKDAAS